MGCSMVCRIVTAARTEEGCREHEYSKVLRMIHSTVER